VEESDEIHTQWNLLALSVLESSPQQVVRSRDRARAWLKDRVPGVSTESLVTNLLVAHRFKEKERARGLLERLLAEQHADGGWGWLRGSKQSDAFATGQALYALGALGKDGSDPNVRRAWAYLVKTQTAGGAWKVSNAVASKQTEADRVAFKDEV